MKWSNLSDTRGLFASNQMKTRPRKGMWGAECSLNRVKCKMNDPPRSNINNEPCQTPRLPGSRLRFLILASSILSSLWAWKVKPWSIASIYLYSYQTQYQWRLIDVVLEMSDFGSPTAQQGWLNIHWEGNYYDQQFNRVPTLQNKALNNPAPILEEVQPWLCVCTLSSQWNKVKIAQLSLHKCVTELNCCSML